MAKRGWNIAILAITLIGGLAIGSGIGVKHERRLWENRVSEKILSNIQEYSSPLDDWETLILAMSKTESDFDFLARGTHNDLGLLQETEIFVEEVNRILGDQVYSHTDALEPEKAIEMFSVYQDKYNPEHKITRAINVHNPNGDNIGYSIRVRQNIEWVKRYEKVRSILTQN